MKKKAPLKRDTVIAEIRKLRHRFYNDGRLTEIEKAFLYGALFALEWMMLRNRRFGPERFIVWRRKSELPFRPWKKP